MLVNSKSNGLSTNDVLPKRKVPYSNICAEAVMFNKLRSEHESSQGFNSYLKEVRK